MSKCVIVEFKEPETAAPAVIYEIDSKDPVEALQEEEPQPSLNAHIQDIQLMLLKIGDHKVAFKLETGIEWQTKLQRNISFENNAPILYFVAKLVKCLSGDDSV
ncbi:hypothetical protein YC2023_066627 [Brassica napus]